MTCFDFSVYDKHMIEKGDKHMKFIRAYMDNTEQRHLLNEMTSEIFDFSFEKWYNAGYFESEYIPYSYIEDGRMVANASANIMRFTFQGTEKRYIQIGTVMTRPAYRNRGLARELIERIIRDYQDNVDGFYLFGNLRAVGFYEHIGFKHLNQWKYYSNSLSERDAQLPGFVPAGEEMRPAYVHMLKNAANNAIFDHLNRCSLQMFYTMDMKDVFYCEDLDCFAVMHIENETLHLQSIISKRELDVETILKRINHKFSYVEFGFTPKNRYSYRAEIFDGADEYRLFYKGDSLKLLEDERLYFPIMSHA